MNEKTIDLDSILDEWVEEVENSEPIKEEKIEDIVNKYKEEQRQTKTRMIIRCVLAGLMIAMFLPFAPDLTTSILFVLTYMTLLFFVIEGLVTKRKLRLQDHAVTVTEFCEHRKQIIDAGCKHLRLGRYFLYPLFSVNMINCLFFSKLPGLWYVSLILITVLITVLTLSYLEKWIKEYEKMSRSFEV